MQQNFFAFSTSLVDYDSDSRFDLNNFLAPSGSAGTEFKGPLLSPTRAIVNITMYIFAFVVPILYWAIFRFRNTFDAALSGDI